MCGIFGIAVSQNMNTYQDIDEVQNILNDLFILSESRGKEASGLATLTADGIDILKSPLAASQLCRTGKYKNLISKKNHKNYFACIGHSRLVTNGTASLNMNNQPSSLEDIACVHNGIITNDSYIFDKLKKKPSSQLDTEALLSLLSSYLRKYDLNEAIAESYKVIEGSASCAFLQDGSESIVLATNNGSLYFIHDSENKSFIFASEEIILQTIKKKYISIDNSLEITRLKPNHLTSINLQSFKENNFSWSIDKSCIPEPYDCSYHASKIKDHSGDDFPDFHNISRCTKCILPYTFPYISFDSNGVCNYCNNYEPQGSRDHDSIKEIIEPYRSLKNGYGQDCIIGLSGGRDSCYALHYVKEVLGMNPVAYTYDWGLVTDTARRNIFKMCGQLGVEHILVSADIRKKRQNIRKNIEAWLRKPNLFMIPLFMAGDKQFYYHAHRLRKQLNIKLFMFGAGNTLEATDFKVGFANIKNNSRRGLLTQLKAVDKFWLLSKYGLEFLANPSYINSSLFDTAEGFYSSYILRDDYTYLYHHIPWIESEVESVLKEKYGWEGATDTPTSWRVGDGTAAFYNYIYYTVAGFTEHDTFRSNQIREGMIDRQEALTLVEQENKPRWSTLEWYSSVVGFSLDEALIKIHQMPKLY
ncbi:hypothetical protein N9T19_01170 [Pseudomonadota bacterium]|jgi:glutamine---fructose-6-phosphate transaminase (isomerizing)|nr:hypothetical protein [Pseudomonadota bacterium]